MKRIVRFITWPIAITATLLWFCVWLVWGGVFVVAYVVERSLDWMNGFCDRLMRRLE